MDYEGERKENVNVLTQDEALAQVLRIWRCARHGSLWMQVRRDRHGGQKGARPAAGSPHPHLWRGVRWTGSTT